jgi:hypothetical protein
MGIIGCGCSCGILEAEKTVEIPLLGGAAGYHGYWCVNRGDMVEEALQLLYICCISIRWIVGYGIVGAWSYPRIRSKFGELGSYVQVLKTLVLFWLER